jgi:uncharacterized RDD family membrane protein YckC
VSTSEPGQQMSFAYAASGPRVIPFASLTSPAERESIRARAADLSRPAPLKNAKMEVRHARSRKRRSADQRRLEFPGEDEILALPQSHIICDAPVAPSTLRVEAALIDAALILLGCSFGAAIFGFQGGKFVFDRHILPSFALALITVPFIYKLLWTFAGRDTIGMSCAGLCLVDFDGNPPSQERRYQRLFGGLISSFAAGIGLVWALVDEDGLTWHDHISSTFPTIASEN